MRGEDSPDIVGNRNAFEKPDACFARLSIHSNVIVSDADKKEAQ